MILEHETKEKFGYISTSLTQFSTKRIVVRCDYCNEIFLVTMKNRTQGYIKHPSDACKKCRFKKREQVSLLKYGVKNSAQRTDVKNKISNANADRLRSEEFKKQTKETMLEKYGVENASQSPELNAKRVNTLLKNYGVDNPTKSQEIIDKVKETLVERYGENYKEVLKDKIKENVQDKYGVDNVFQLDEVKEKIKKTNLLKYNTEHHMQNDDIKNKVIETNRAKYGCDNVLKNEDIKDRIKKTNLEKYGFEHATQNIEVQQRIKETNLEKYGFEHATQNTEIKEKIINTKIEKGIIKTYNNKTMAELASEIEKPYSTFVVQAREHGFEYAIKQPIYTNGLETYFAEFLKEINVDFIHQYRVDNKISDFFLPAYNIVIELDGLFWHSDKVISDKKYHYSKRKLYENNGLIPLFFRSDEIFKKFDIVKSIILNKLGKNKRVIYGRHCDIKVIDKVLAREFQRDNHLMGCGSGVPIGLFYNDELVSLIQMRLKDNNSKIYDVSRFCNSLNTTVIGGFSKLLKYFMTNYDYNSITTFIDRRYGIGSYLSNLGFEKIKECISFNWTDGINSFHRMRFPCNTGYEYGYAKIWDCGQDKWCIK